MCRMYFYNQMLKQNQYAVPHILQLLHSFLMLIVKHHDLEQDAEVQNLQLKILDLFGFSNI